MAACVIIGGGFLLLTNNDGTVGDPDHPPSISTEDDAEPGASDPEDGALPEEDEGDGSATEPPEQVSFYYSLSEEQRQLLSRLEAAIRAVDYNTAYNIQMSTEFHALCHAIPDLGAFWYYPDDETSILVVLQHGNYGYGYAMEIFEGRGGEGRYLASRYGGIEMNYVLSIANYSGGRANGPFTYHILNFGYGETEFFVLRGNLRDGAAYGPVYVDKDGETFEHEYEPEWYDWWPNWPEAARGRPLRRL